MGEVTTPVIRGGDSMNYADKPWLKSYKLGPYKLEHSLAPFPEEPVFKFLDDACTCEACDIGQ